MVGARTSGNDAGDRRQAVHLRPVWLARRWVRTAPALSRELLFPVLLLPRRRAHQRLPAGTERWPGGADHPFPYDGYRWWQTSRRWSAGPAWPCVGLRQGFPPV